MKKTFVYFLMLFIFALFIVFYKWMIIPPSLDFDEVEFARLAIYLDNKPYIPYSSLATGHATLYFYVLLFFLKIFGINDWVIRLPSAIFGIFGAVILFLLFKKIFKNSSITIYNNFSLHIFFLISILFIGSRWYFQFSRFAFEATFLIFLELTSLYFVVLSEIKTNRFWKIIFISIAGLFAGLAFNSYTPGRIFWILPLIYIFFNKTLNFGAKTQKAILYSIVFLVFSFPLLSYFFSHRDLRIQQLSYLSNENISISTKILFFSENVIKTAKMFYVEGDANGRHNFPLKPSLNFIYSFFFTVGFIYVLKKRNRYDMFFIFYFIISLIPALFTYPSENPHMLRTVTVLPSVVYFIGRAIEFIRDKFNSRFILLFVIILFAISLIYEMRTYFLYQAQIMRESFRITNL